MKGEGECEMIDSNHIDVGEGMAYCKIHECWWPINGHCEGCEIAKVAGCVENDGVWTL